MSDSIGRTRWAIADGYVPGQSTGSASELASHESICILNATEREARIELTVFYADRDPAGPYRLTVSPQRTRHLRLNDLTDPEPIPAATPFACVLESDVPIVVQHARLDARQAANTLLSTIAFPDGA